MHITELTQISSETLRALAKGDMEKGFARDVFNGVGKTLAIHSQQMKYHHLFPEGGKIEFFEPKVLKK